ncbi:MAG: hypothetical protein J0H68_02500 [Sphingobacteriia bacterium]|nr:hypothetical protein [Sphingobacteriia bacterium]
MAKVRAIIKNIAENTVLKNKAYNIFVKISHDYAHYSLSTDNEKVVNINSYGNMAEGQDDLILFALALTYDVFSSFKRYKSENRKFTITYKKTVRDFFLQFKDVINDPSLKHHVVKEEFYKIYEDLSITLFIANLSNACRQNYKCVSFNAHADEINKRVFTSDDFSEFVKNKPHKLEHASINLEEAFETALEGFLDSLNSNPSSRNNSPYRERYENNKEKGNFNLITERKY